ncbi:Succinate dehydrogenase cytochrome b560 subunit, mitochondrial [Geodia barretti]|nr:Succinate dehydrogenase cytochrome b560 subunit, mitochondrial [Geodia barretti]
MVWVLSFGHRTSGAVLTSGVTAASIAYLISGTQFTEFISPLQSVASQPVLWTSAKFLMALPLSYHMVNGIRHLAWDTGRGFELKTLYKTGYLMLTATLLLTGVLTLYKPSS